MPAIENVTRRGAVYWWRRRVRFVAAESHPTTIATTVSLLTKDQAVARRRASAMTARSETVRMGLYQQIEQEGLTAGQVTTVFQEEMVRYRNMLAHQQSAIQAGGSDYEQSRFSQMLAIYAALNGDFAMNGFSDYLGLDYVGSFNERFAMLDEEARNHLYAMLGREGDLPANLLAEAQGLLVRAGLPVTPERSENARRIMCEARAMAAATFQDPALKSTEALLLLLRGLAQAGGATSTLILPVARACASSAPELLTAEQARFAAMMPVEAVEAFIQAKPKARGHAGQDRDGPAASQNRSRAKVWGDSQRRQFRAAAYLFGKSNGGRTFASVNQDDLNRFYDHLQRLPASHHKSPRHETMSLEDICLEAASVIEGDPLSALIVGLDVGTVNRHFANLKRLSAWVASKTPMAPLDFSDFILDEDDRHDRDERDPYTIQQGHELFALPIWTGAPSWEERYSTVTGTRIWHDAAYWVMIIVWYSGMRREEACKLLIDDIGEENGIHFFHIRHTRAGSVKNVNSVRIVPIASELKRLGFLEFVAALSAAGEHYVFQEIMPGRGKRTLGDVFFKNVWLRIKPLLTLLKPGQAVHSGRHMVSTELKMLRVFEEFRADLLGQDSGGENANRYADATRLELLLEIVERIPKVTAHLPSFTEVFLLPETLRCARPTRETTGARQRSRQLCN